MDKLISLIFLIGWFGGIYATPGLLKIIAVLIPPFAWYEIIAAIIARYNLI